MTDGQKNFSEDYRTDNLDERELQAQLYAEIYYDSNVEGESQTMETSNMIQINNVITKENCQLGMEYESENQCFLPETRDFQNMSSINWIQSADNTINDKEMTSMTNNYSKESSEHFSIIHKENKENSSKKNKSSKCTKSKHSENSEKDDDAIYSKYNVVSKHAKKQKLLAKQTDKDEYNSDSEESIFEIPVPPKPKPLLIELQDSDEENSARIQDDVIFKKWENTSLKTYSRTSCKNKTRESETSNSYQNISSKSKETNKSQNSNIINSDKIIQTSNRTQEITEDIILNCTTIQRGAKNINEIKQLSKSLRANQENKSIENANKNCKKTSPPSRPNDENIQQEVTGKKSCIRVQQNVDKNNVYNVEHADANKALEMESCNSVINQKIQCNSENDYLQQKRQCITQQNSQNVISQGNDKGEKRNTSVKEYFKPMPEEMKNYYNLSRGQQNFDIVDLQQDMSKDPKMWAILDEDIMPCPSSRGRNRFWNIRCTNCRQDGHLRYDCASPRKISCCYMCGAKGHMEYRCPQKMCLTCGKLQRTFRNTCEHCRVLYCTMCNSIGHEVEQCPDLWRRYHQTTDMNSMPQDPGNVMKPPRLLYCCNCAKRGHESSTCKEYRWSEHFPTPAAVTNYMDGPTYIPYVPSSAPKIDVVSKIIENKTLTSENITNIQSTMVENVNPVEATALSSNIDFLVLPTSQKIQHPSQMEDSLKSSSMANKIWSTVKTNLRQTKINLVTFSSIIYSFRHFHSKDHKDARMILENLTSFYTNRKPTLNKLISRKIDPVFLHALNFEKEFEVKIGFTENGILYLQLLAMKEYIEYLYDLLYYWLNLPDDEKYYGIDVSLPKNPLKMFNVLNSRMPQIEKMQSIEESKNDLQMIYNNINKLKTKLNEPCVIKRKSLCKQLWRWQTKFLMIMNTKPEPNVLIRTFQEVMKRFELERYHMGDKIDVINYLRFTLLYNQLFVPHTPDKKTKFECVDKNTNNSLQMQQKSETMEYEQGNVVYNPHFSATSFYTSQNKNLDSSFAINNQQNDEMLLRKQNMNNIQYNSFEMSNAVDHNCDTIVKIKDYTQDSPIMPLNTKFMPIKDSGNSKDQLINKINIKSKVSKRKQNINMNSSVSLLNMTRPQIAKRLRQINNISGKIEDMHDIALDLINMARTFKVPHMINAVDKLQKHIKDRTIKIKHIQMLSRLLLLEQKYQKHVNSYHSNLKLYEQICNK